MKVCPQCGLENPDHAQSCAECDSDLYEVRASRPAQPEPTRQPQPFHARASAPRKSHLLRNVLLIILGLIVIGAIVGGTRPWTESSTGPVGLVSGSPAETASSSALGLKWGEAAISDDGVMLVISAPVDDTANLDEYEREFLGEGNACIYCLVTITNNSAAAFTYNPFDFTLTDSASVTIDRFQTTFCSQPELHSGELLAGRSITGALAAVVPAGRTIGYVDYQPGFSGVAASWSD